MHWLVLLGALGAAMAAESDGLFTEQQAKRGADWYAKSCANCHGAELTGGGSPPLAGETFLKKWGGRTVKALHDANRQMPLGQEGSLPEDAYYAVTAFLLQCNGHKAGVKALGTDARAMDTAKVRPGK